MTTSVVVVSHRPGEWLVPCLESATSQADEVVVVDNGSPGGYATAEARKLGLPVVRSEENLGFAGGANLGIGRSTGDVVALLNDDAVAGPAWLRNAEAVLAAPDVAAVTPKVVLAGEWREVTLDDPAWRAPGDARDLGRRLQSVTVDGVDVIDRLAGAGIHRLEQDPGDPGKRWRWTAGSTPFYIPLPDAGEGACVLIDGEEAPPGPVVRLINNAGSYLRQDAYLGDHALETPDDGRVDQPAERFAASATALAARASTFAGVGLLAAPYFAYYEDSDWSWRARLAGMRLVYDPTSTVEHRRGATSGGVADPRVRLLAERNRLLTAVRNAPLPVAARLVRERLEAGPDQGIRRALLRRLGWAAGTRLQMRRRWKLSPEEVWGRWAGADVTWDVTPARTGGW